MQQMQQLEQNAQFDIYEQFVLDAEEDKLIDRLLAQASKEFTENNFAVQQDDVDAMKSINNRRKFGYKIDRENLSTSEMKAAIEGDQELEDAIKLERKLHKQ